MNPAESLAQQLQLLPHPEGGYYRETYRSTAAIPQSALPGYLGDRHHSTAIYFLLTAGNFSAFHRIRQDEVWHFYSGDPVEVIEISPEGTLTITELGTDFAAGQVPQHVVPGGAWFGSRVKAGGEYGLTGCTVAPGFDFADFELAERSMLNEMFPEHASLIAGLTR